MGETDSELEKITNEEEKIIFRYIRNRFQKHNKYIRNYILLGFAGTAIITTAVNIGAWIIFYDIAKKEKESIKLDINRARYNLKNDLEKGAREILTKYLDQYAPHIDTNLPLEKRLPLLFQQEEENTRQKWMNSVKSDLVPYLENRVYGRPMTKGEIKILANQIKEMINSGELNFWKLVQPQEERK